MNTLDPSNQMVLLILVGAFASAFAMVLMAWLLIRAQERKWSVYLELESLKKRHKAEQCTNFHLQGENLAWKSAANYGHRALTTAVSHIEFPHSMVQPVLADLKKREQKLQEQITHARKISEP